MAAPARTFNPLTQKTCYEKMRELAQFIPKISIFIDFWNTLIFKKGILRSDGFFKLFPPLEIVNSIVLCKIDCQ